MKVAEFDINAAEGIYLLSNYRLDNKFYPQGHILTAEDIIFFKLYGIRRVYGAEAEDFDLDNARVECINDVKRINGSISLAQAVRDEENK
jgi:hypothetical protein